MSARVCDVLIVGGGPAGLFLASLLAQQGVDVVVLERRTGASTHSRAIGLHPPALDALRSLGLAEAAVSQGVPVRAGVGRSRGHRLGDLTFDRGGADHPFVLALPQHHTEALLAHRLAELAPTALCRGWEVLDVQDEHAMVRVTAARSAGGTEEATTWRAQVVVGADGPRSLVRARSGIRTSLKSYPDTYLMGDFADTTDDDDTAVIHLEPDGVVESFPLPGRTRRWVAHTGTALADPSPTQLVAIIRRRTGEAPDPASNTMVSAFTVRRNTARRMVTGRRVLIGDAAHEISPIGGQGMTLGWLDALALAPLLEQFLAEGTHHPLQENAAFRRFERSRRQAARTAACLAELNMALGRPVPAPIGLARDALLQVVLSTPARGPLARAFTMAWA